MYSKTTWTNGSGSPISAANLDKIEGELVKAYRSTVSDLTAMLAADLNNDDRLLSLSHTSVGDGGGGWYRWDAASTATDNNGTILQLDAGGTGRLLFLENQKITFATFGCIGDGDGEGAGTDNATALQSALDHLNSSAGPSVIEAHLGKYYRSDSALTLMADEGTTPDFNARIIEGYGAIIDFSASGLTSGTLFQIGADSSADAPEEAITRINNLHVVGPETNWPTDATISFTPATSCIGIELTQARNVTFDCVRVSRCHTGIKASDTWAFETRHVDVQRCMIGLYLDSYCTIGEHTLLTAHFCAYGVLIQSTGWKQVSEQTFLQPRFENSWFGMVVDPIGDFNDPYVKGLRVIGWYSEDIVYDCFSIGYKYVAANQSDVDNNLKDPSISFMERCEFRGSGKFSYNKTVGGKSTQRTWRGFNAPTGISDSSANIRNSYVHLFGNDSLVYAGVMPYSTLEISGVDGATDHTISINRNGATTTTRGLKHNANGHMSIRGASDNAWMNYDLNTTGDVCTWKHIDGTAAEIFDQYNNGGGDIGQIETTTGSNLVLTSTSDYRKKDITGGPIDILKLVDLLHVKRGKFKGCDTEQLFFIAHEVQEAGLGWLVSGDKDAMQEKDGETVPKFQSLDHAGFTPVLWAIMEAMLAKIKHLESRI